MNAIDLCILGGNACDMSSLLKRPGWWHDDHGSDAAAWFVCWRLGVRR